jgi:hypothetical protein
MELDIDMLVTAVHKVIDVLNDLEYRSTLVWGSRRHPIPARRA